MRIVNIIGALNGACALIMLAVAMHAMRGLSEHGMESIRMAAFVQLISGAALIAIANRAGRLNAVAGTMIGAGAAIFAGAIYGSYAAANPMLLFAAPLGGLLMIVGWILLAFAAL